MPDTSPTVPVEHLVRVSRKLTGSSRLINSELYVPQPVRPNPTLVMPRELGLTGDNIPLPVVNLSIIKRGKEPGNAYDLIYVAENGYWEGDRLVHWDGYKEIVASGQLGTEILAGKAKAYVPYLYGFGAQHHVGVKAFTETFTETDHFLVVSPQED